MSFGFGVGDFLAVAKLANDIRKDYADAPEQFRQITSDVRNLAIALVDVDVSLGTHDVGDAQKDNLREIRESCHSVLDDTAKVLNRYSSLDTKTRSLHGRARRVWTRMRWEPDDVRDMRSRITINVAALNSFTGSNVRDTVYRIEERQLRQEDQKILDWLTPIDVAPQHSDYIRQCQLGTGQWLLDSTEYSRWQTVKSDILFCHGIPGAGKTMLSSIVVNDLQETFGIETDIAICYLYCNFNRQDEQGSESVLLSLLKQLSQAAISVPDNLRVLFDQCQFKCSRPNRKEIVETFCSIAGLFSRTYIVLDALDELCISNGCQEQVISGLIELQQTAGVNVLATSRPVPHIMDRFKGYESLEIRASSDDIRRYAKGNIQYLPGFVRRNQELLEEITDVIVDSVDGMFLLAKLHLDALKGKTSPRQLKRTLSNLATGKDAYHEAYVDTMQRIHGQLLDQKELAMNIFMWIVYAKRPLKTSELQHALSVELGDRKFVEDNLPDLDDMLSVCYGLVTVDEESHIIRLIHHTTQEFFDRQGSEFFPNAQQQMTNVCITYLLYDVFGSGRCTSSKDFTQRVVNFPLFEYASECWGHHAMSQADSELIRELLARPSHVQACSQALMAADVARRKQTRVEDEFCWPYIPYNTSSLHLAAYFGLTDMISCTLDGLDPDVQDSMNRTPVWYAAKNGHEDAAGLLLARHCSPDIADKKGCRPLFWAARNGHEALVRLLLDHGVQFEKRDKYGRKPLWMAVFQVHESIVRVLLDKGADVETSDAFGQGILSMAVLGGNEAIVRMLLDRGAQAGRMDRLARTPLFYAARKGDKNMVSLLLRHQAHENLVFDKLTLLPLASGRGFTRTAELARKHDTMIDAKCGAIGLTPLMSAAVGNHSDVINLLLAAGADYNMTDTLGRSPLMVAVEGDRLSAVQILLEVEGLDYDAKDRWGSTAISLAARLGFSKVFHKLAALPNVDLLTKDSFGRSALWWARNQGHEDIAKGIIELNPLAASEGLAAPMGNPRKATNRWTCDICCIRCSDSHYHCSVCIGGDFDICHECHGLGARCLVEGHSLSIEKA